MQSATFPTTLRLQGLDRARYFAPVVFFAFLAALCLILITVSAFLVTMHDAIAITAAGIFGMLAAGGVGTAILRLQLRWLRYSAVPITTDPQTALQAVRTLATQSGWRITRDSASGLEARTPDSLFAEGERVSVMIREHELLVASICDPNVGFSLTGHRRCLAYCDQVRRAVLAVDPLTA